MFNLTGFLTYAFVVTFTPGPNNITSMVLASQNGYRKTLRFMLGVASGFFIIMLLSSYFNLMLLRYIPKVKVFMSFFGIAYMIFLALKILGIHFPWSNGAQGEKKEPLSSFKIGMLLQFVNPKGIIYGITIISTFITPFYSSTVSLVLFGAFLSFLALVSTSCWAIFGSLFNRFLTKYQRQFNIVMAALLFYTAYTILLGLFH